MASKDSQILPQKEQAVFKTIVVGTAAARFAGCRLLLQMCPQARWHTQCVSACVPRDSLTGPIWARLWQKFYEIKQYKKGLKSADSILKKFPEHGRHLFLSHARGQ